MKELNQAKKAMLLCIAIAAVVIFALFFVCESFGCFGCNMCDGGWSCFEGCTKCIGCAFGCE